MTAILLLALALGTFVAGVLMALRFAGPLAEDGGS